MWTDGFTDAGSMGILYLTTFLTPTLSFLYFLVHQAFKLKNTLEYVESKVSRQYMPIFIEIAPRAFKISRFESNIPEKENHK